MNKKFVFGILTIYLIIFAVFVSTIDNSFNGEKTILTITNRKYGMIRTSSFNYDENGEIDSSSRDYHLSNRDIYDEVVHDVQKYKIFESEKIIILIGKIPYHNEEGFKYFVLNYETDICNYYDKVEDIIEIEQSRIEEVNWLIPHDNS